MVTMGCNLDEVANFINQIKITKERLSLCNSYREDVSSYGKNYEKIKDFFCNFTRYLLYHKEVHFGDFYRVRKSEEKGKPYSSCKDLTYPPDGTRQKNRMNNTSFQVLYTSLNEFTAIAESKLGYGDSFQLTRFHLDQKMLFYKLGLFSELYFNASRDSSFVKNRMRELFGSFDHDRTIQGYSALEIAMSNILYAKDDNDFILSSILADAIFSSNPSIDAIMYPSVRYRYGTNVAFKKESADKLKKSASFLNNVIKVYDNGFFKYHTTMECHNFSNPDSLEYTIVAENTTYR